MIQNLTRRERQMLANLDAVCLHQVAPPVEFLPEEYHPIREDRVLFVLGPGWFPHLHRKDLFIRSTEMIKKHNPLDRLSPTALYGYRGLAAFAAPQPLVHFDEEAGWFIEWDFDLGNPAALKAALLREQKRDLWSIFKGIVGAVVHLGEYTAYRAPQLIGRSAAKTNPFVVRKWLRLQGIDVPKAA
ncbi:MAG TPA: hypothetical protein VFI02_19295 [Armatimonadota bacterium]|nr:hypothetical protein [Armatimonadota bacterium]